MRCKNSTSGVGVGHKFQIRFPVLLGIRLRLHPKTSDSIRLRLWLRNPARYVADATQNLQLWIAGRGVCCEFFERVPLTKVRAWSLVTRATTDAPWVCLMLCISCLYLSHIYCWRDRSRHSHSNSCNIVEEIKEKRCCGHVCVGQALHWVHCKRSHAAITTPQNERFMYCAIIFPCGSVWTMFSYPSLTKTPSVTPLMCGNRF